MEDWKKGPPLLFIADLGATWQTAVCASEVSVRTFGFVRTCCTTIYAACFTHLHSLFKSIQGLWSSKFHQGHNRPDAETATRVYVWKWICLTKKTSVRFHRSVRFHSSFFLAIESANKSRQCETKNDSQRALQLVAWLRSCRNGWRASCNSIGENGWSASCDSIGELHVLVMLSISFRILHLNGPFENPTQTRWIWGVISWSHVSSCFIMFHPPAW